MTRQIVVSALALLVIAGCRPDDRLIDQEAVFARYDWWDNHDWDWYSANIPFVETPDTSIDEVYYYRWEVMTKHLTYGSPETGYLFTEFIDRPFWSGTYGGIACPLGHQLAEVRWLKNPRIIDDFARYWIDTEGARPRNYSNWYGAALWDLYRVWGDSSWIVSMLPYMEEQYEGWMADHFDAEHGLFFRTGHDDGMEVNINSRQLTGDWVVEGYRPTLNSYVYGDLLAMTRAAELAGDSGKAQLYDASAQALRGRVSEELWDDRRSFFLHQFVSNHEPGIAAKTRTYDSGPYAGDSHGRELIGYVPWQFHLPEAKHAVAWKYLMDPAYFKAPYGPTTAEQGDPQFLISPNCCVWSGQSWPFATTQTLVAMANLLNDYDQDFVDRSDYADLFKTYARTHYKDGRPYIAESANPIDGSWYGSDMPNHSEHYLHSGYVNPLLSGLLGIRPTDSDTLRIRPSIPADWDYFAAEGLLIHGREVDVVWDRTGEKYRRGAGLSVWVDGNEAGRSPATLTLDVVVPAAKSSMEFVRPDNIAVNNGTAFPEITASYSDPSTPPFNANDGAIWYHAVPTNRWTAVGSPNERDWVALDFGSPATVSEIKLYFLDDREGASNGEQGLSSRLEPAHTVAPPSEYWLESWIDGAWKRMAEVRRVPESPRGRLANTIRIDQPPTEKLRIVMQHAPGFRSGLSEIEVWSAEGQVAVSPERATTNRALNPGRAEYPRVQASFAPGQDDLGLLVDGQFGLTTYQSNRWIARGSPNESDWIEIDFGSEQSVTRADVYLWGLAPRYLGRTDSTVMAPRALSIEIRHQGAWRPVQETSRTPEMPAAMALNSITFAPETTDAVRIVFEHDLPAVSGATEIQIWAH